MDALNLRSITMAENSELLESPAQKLTLNLAIVGGGERCKALLELLQKDLLPDLTINIAGVCDPNPEAEGLKMAKELGIYTSDKYTDLFSIDNLSGLIELTSSKDTLLEVIRQRPKGLWVIDHNTARLIMKLFRLNETLKAKEQEVALERMVSEFLLQHGNERIVLLSPDFTILEASEAYLEAVNSTKEKRWGNTVTKSRTGIILPVQNGNQRWVAPDGNLEDRAELSCNPRAYSRGYAYHLLRP